ncbi:hypothetical protein ES708_22579 [subsurface metagenome]
MCLKRPLLGVIPQVAYRCKGPGYHRYKYHGGNKDCGHDYQGVASLRGVAQEALDIGRRLGVINKGFQNIVERGLLLGVHILQGIGQAADHPGYEPAPQPVPPGFS